MDSDKTLFLEEQFPLLLAAADEALAAGEPDSFVAVVVPEELRPRLEREIGLCRLIRDVLTSRASSSTPVPTEPATEHGGQPAYLPTQIGRFQVHRELGRGGFGIVFQAFDPHLGREVALKVPRPEIALSPALRARFRQEARAAATLDHPNLVPVYEAGEENGDCYIASAYCPGETLAHWLRHRKERVPFRMAARIVAALASALEHAHRRGVVHRDLKPANVLLEWADRSSSTEVNLGFVPRLTDFGLAKLLDEVLGAEAPSGPTASGAIMGTPSYMAPEQAEGNSKALGPGADIYALGVILYELLTGKPPFEGDSPLSTLLLVRQCEPLSPSKLRPGLPRDLETICLKCLRKEPHRRYESAAALGEDLRRYLAGEPILARRTGPLLRLWLWCRRKPGLAATITAALLTVIIVTTVSFVRVMHERDIAESRRREAVANLRKAREAVDRMLTRVSEEKLKNIPQVEPVQLALLEDALEFYRGFARQAHDDPEVLLETGMAYDRLGTTYGWLGRRDEAETCFQEAFALRKRLADAFPSVAAYKRDLALSYANLGGSARERGRMSEAVVSLETALSLLAKLAAADPAEPLYLLRQGAAREQLGIVMITSGKRSEAEANFNQTVQIFDGLAALSPDNYNARVRAAVARGNLAGVLALEGRFDDGIRVLLRNLEFWEKRATDNPSDSDSVSKQALTSANLADLYYRSGRKAEAERYLRRAAEIRARLARDYPNTPYLFVMLAEARIRLAKLAAERGDLREARQLQEQALASRKRALALAPGNADYRKAAITTHAALVETLIRSREHEEASKRIEDLVALAPESERVHAASFLARCVPLAAADPGLKEPRRRDLAAAYSDRSMVLLREAAGHGPLDLETLEKDRGFDPLRSRADFRELLTPHDKDRSAGPRK